MKQESGKSLHPFERVTIHLVSHNHWDREWIFTAKYTNRWLVPFFNNLFNRLKEQPHYRFVLDGQTLIVEDYLNQLSYDEAKEKEKLIRKYVQEGRLLVGPAYLQPDWSLVSGEALVRNLLIGHQMAENLGGVMKVGWMLDNFGQIAQAPQIYRGFGIQGVFVWRGIEMPAEQLRSEFWWEAPNHSRVMAVYLINSYRNAMVLSLTREIAKERIISQAQALLPFATTPNVLLMNGYEQVPWPDDILPIIDEVNREIEPEMHCIQSTPPDYLEAIMSYDPDLPVLRGYFYSGRYAPILKGVYSSRSHLNLKNHECQRELERWAEPFTAFTWAFGGEYPHTKLLDAWKTLLLNHTHDDICGCCVDTIARDMEERFERVYAIANEISTESLRTLAQTVDTSMSEGSSAIVLFNPSAVARSEVVGFRLEIPESFSRFSLRDSQGQLVPYQVVRREGSVADIYFWADQVPALGFKTFYLIKGNRKVDIQPRVRASKRERVLENDILKVKINRNGTLTVTHKPSGQVYENLGYFEDGGDAGDTYDYSYPKHDTVIDSLNQRAQIDLELAGPLLARFKVTLHLKLPKALSPDRQTRSTELTDYPIVTYVELAAGSRHVELRTVINNVAKDHRLRLLFPTGINSEVSYAEEPFDIATFPVQSPQYQENVPERFKALMLAGRYKKPVETHPFQNFVGMYDHHRGLTIISRRLTEYEVLKDNTIALTLLRSVGWLARYDLLTREGDVGPNIFTPEAQCLGKHVFSYAIYPHEPDWNKACPHFESEIHNMKMRAIQTSIHDGNLPDEFSFIGWTHQQPAGAFRITSVKKAENDSGIIFRFYNTQEVRARGRLRHWGRVSKAFQTNLNEEVISEFPIKEGLIHVEARGKEIVTLKLKFNRLKLILEPVDEETKRLIPLLPSEDLPQVDSPPVITREEVQSERQRARELAKKLHKMRDRVFLMEDEIERTATKDVAKLAELQRLKSEVATLTRQLYECRISALLNSELYIMTTIEDELEEIGEEMSWSRIKKRVGEYLMHYFEQLLDTQKTQHSEGQ